MADTDTTLLVITGNVGVPPFAARNLTQTLDPIEQSSQVRRTVNGNAVDTAGPQFRKYKSTITCTDQQALAVDGAWPGDIVTVHCVAELSYIAGGSPGRSVVPGSSRTENGFVFYRPILTMMVINNTANDVEWAAEKGWTLELEEV